MELNNVQEATQFFNLTTTEETFPLETEMMEILNGRLLFDKNIIYPPQLYVYFGAYDDAMNDGNSLVEILKHGVKNGADALIRKLYLICRNDNNNNSLAKLYLKKAIKQGNPHAYFISYQNIMENINSEFGKTNRTEKLNLAMKHLNISFNGNCPFAIDAKYMMYLKQQESQEIPPNDLKDITKHFADLNCGMAILNYAIVCYNNADYSESKQYYEKAIYSKQYYAISMMLFGVEKMKEKPFNEQQLFFSEEDVSKFLIFSIDKCYNLAYIVEVIEHYAKQRDREKCAHYIQIMYANKDVANDLFEQLFDVVEKYGLFEVDGKYLFDEPIFKLYHDNCTTVVESFECQFCMEEGMTIFIPFGCNNKEHGCCKSCYKKCPFCPYKCGINHAIQNSNP